MTIPPKLHTWATQVSQPYLIHHAPGSLEMNTIHQSWNDLNRPDSMDVDGGEWIPVQPRGRSRDRTSATNSSSAPNPSPGENASLSPPILPHEIPPSHKNLTQPPNLIAQQPLIHASEPQPSTTTAQDEVTESAVATQFLVTSFVNTSLSVDRFLRTPVGSCLSLQP